LPAAIPTWRDLRRRLFRRRWLALIERLIAVRSAQTISDAPRDLLDLLAEATDPETGRRFSERRLADQVATMIVAGHATSAVALFWSCYLLASTRDDGVLDFGDRLPSSSALVLLELNPHSPD
jgi:cytochrome P450